MAEREGFSSIILQLAENMRLLYRPCLVSPTIVLQKRGWHGKAGSDVDVVLQDR
jgi:hypothetical protein